MNPQNAVHPVQAHRASQLPTPHAAASQPDILAVLRQRLNQVLIGKNEPIELVLACLLARGHLLLDDLPGTGKTTLAKALAASLGGKLARIQCTPDLLPTDITGFNIFNPKSREFEFHPGPVFSDILLADELNRTTPRTQSALLEAMAERQVTIDNTVYTLSPSFFVIATQNPIDSHGAYPLPEAQLDRFTMRLEIGYPSREAQLRILEEAIGDPSHPASADPLLSRDELTTLQDRVTQIRVHPRIREYLVDLVEATRNDRAIHLGVSPRGMLLWQRTAQAWALLANRDYVTPSDLVRVGRPVLAVRILAAHNELFPAIDRIFSTVPAPEFK